jgi:tRNA (guanine-N7-)-methyltransferase
MQPMPEPEPTARRGARTTHRRGRMTPTRIAILDDLGPRWMLDAAAPLDPPTLDAAFGRTAPRLLDIGVGNGLATLAWAGEHPDHDVVAVELHRPGIAHLVRHLDTDGPANVRVVDADITALLDAVPDGTLAGVRVLFPDPWPKRRHHKRRLVDPGFVGIVADRLHPGGRLHLGTDWPDYADAMRIALATEPRLVPVVDVDDGPAVNEDGAPIEAPTRWRSRRPERPITAYEQRGLDAGRPIADLVAVRT